MEKNGLLIGNWFDGTGDLEWNRVLDDRRKFGIPAHGCTVAVNYINVRPHSGQGKDRPMHTHDYEQIMLITDGDGRLECDGVFYPMHKGSYAVIPPNVPHRFDASDSCDPHLVNIDIFTPERVEFVTWKDGKKPENF